MRKLIYGTLGIILISACGLAVYLFILNPNVDPPPEMQVEGSTAQIERGKYLANHVSVCIDCHSSRDWSTFAGPIIPGSEGQGGEEFGHEMGFPGTFYASNITPYSLSDWSDGEIFRAITSGISKDGSPLFPVMPYQSYNKMAPKDVRAIIAYIRSLKPIENTVPESEPDFPVNIIMRTMPTTYDSTAVERPSPQDIIEYGKYLVTIGGCNDCHTAGGQNLAGGMEFKMSGGTVRSANITPHNEMGIGRWSKEQFVAIFKQFDLPADSLPNSSERAYSTIMPWQMYAGMKQTDLEAIYEYLKSIEPQENSVDKFTPKE